MVLTPDPARLRKSSAPLAPGAKSKVSLMPFPILRINEKPNIISYFDDNTAGVHLLPVFCRASNRCTKHGTEMNGAEQQIIFARSLPINGFA
jgi:hypothetical protein